MWTVAPAGWLTGYSGASAADPHRFPYSRSLCERTGLGWPFLAAAILTAACEAVYTLESGSWPSVEVERILVCFLSLLGPYSEDLSHLWKN